MGVDKGRSYSNYVAFVRPSNVSAYAAGTVIGPSTSAGGGILTFSSMCEGIEDFLITTSRFEYDAASIPVGMSSLVLYLYGATPPSNLADGAAWTFAANDKAAFMGYVNLGSPVVLGSFLYSQSTFLNVQLKAPGSANGIIFAYLVTVGGFTPASGTAVKVGLHAAGF